MVTLLFGCLLLIQLSLSQAGEFADYLSKCSPTSKEQLNQCLYTAIEELRPLLARGVPEINLKPLEPLYIDRIEFIDRQGGRDIRANFTNINVYGMSNFITKNLDLDPESLKLYTEFDFPSLYMNGTYEMDGKIRLLIELLLQGQGDFWTSLRDVSAFGSNNLELLRGPKDTYIRVTSTNVDFNARNVRLRLKNLFNGNSIGEVINEVLNDNSELLLEQMKPALVAHINRLTQELMNSALSELPITNLAQTYESSQP